MYGVHFSERCLTTDNICRAGACSRRKTRIGGGSKPPLYEPAYALFLYLNKKSKRRNPYEF